MIPISFNSFGDIVCAANLALQISRALSSSAGASYEYQYLIQELNTLAYSLQLADAATRTGMLDRAVVNGILAEIARCQTAMDCLWGRIRGYQKALGGTGPSRGNSWRKIGWSLFKTQDVKETREKLAVHRLNLITLMTACNTASFDELRSQSTRFETKVQIRLNEIYSAVRQLPRRLGYTSANAVNIIDLFGKETIIPMNFCESWEQFQAMMKVVAISWPEFARHFTHSISDSSILVTTNDGHATRVADIEEAWKSAIISRAIISFCWFMVIDDDLKVVECPGTTNQRYIRCCKDCSRNSPLLSPSFEDVKQKSSLVQVGCDPDLARWMATVEETWNQALQRKTYTYVFHNPLFLGCNAKRAFILPLLARGVHWETANA